jgi:glucosyl-dolichyl phosphate glucuronosyltransferase
MRDAVDVSVVMSTYNRCDLLPAALDSLLAQETGDVTYEVVVVDNNSTDRTAQVIESFIARGQRRVRYVFEGRQGLSHGWNTGIAHARAPIVAFADDDVRVARDWVAVIKKAFDAHPEVDFIGFRVLPHWTTPPPAWLTWDHWTPLALQDYGEREVHSTAANPICFVGKAFRREVFRRFGLFRPDLGRVRDGIGSMEDHELQQRLWRAGRRGLYVPAAVMTADVPAERMTRAYHRRWHTGHGAFYAVFRDDELERSAVRVFDVPGHFCVQAAATAVRWAACVLAGHRDRAFMHEVSLRFFVGFVRRRRADSLAADPRSTARELARLARSVYRRLRLRECDEAPLGPEDERAALVSDRRSA